MILYRVEYFTYMNNEWREQGVYIERANAEKEAERLREFTKARISEMKNS